MVKMKYSWKKYAFLGSNLLELQIENFLVVRITTDNPAKFQQRITDESFSRKINHALLVEKIKLFVT